MCIHTGAQGIGIYIIRTPDQIRDPYNKQLIQEYIANPYLLADNLKFDLRVYAVLKSLNPLSIYAAREGKLSHHFQIQIFVGTEGKPPYSRR